MVTMTRRMAFIDALRGLAIFGVIVVHSCGPLVGKLPAFWSNVITSGARGVQLFFVVSAYTLFVSLKAKRDEPRPVASFFIRRFFRIAPLFYLAIVVYLIWDGLGPRYWLGDASHITVWNILANILFVNGWHPLWFNSIMSINWSVAVEMGFYVLVPYLFSKIKNLGDATLLALLSAAVVNVVNPVLMSHSPISSVGIWGAFVNLWLPSQFPVFCLGFVLFYLLEPADERAKPMNLIGWRKWAVGVSITLLVYGAWAGYSFPEHLVWGAFFLLLAYLLACWPVAIFVNRFWVFLGKISFSAYLVHLMVLSVVAKTIMGLPFVSRGREYEALAYLIILVGTLVLTMVVSWVTYRLIEKPGIALGRAVIGRWCGDKPRDAESRVVG